MKDIPHDCPADGQGEGAAAPFPFDLCTEVLHCGILAAANAPRALLPFKGTFGALEELFTGTVMTGSGPMLRFEAMLCLLPLSVSLEDLREKEPWKFVDCSISGTGLNISRAVTRFCRRSGASSRRAAMSRQWRSSGQIWRQWMILCL